MNNRCPHFDEGILPMRRKTYVCNVVVKSSVIIAISLLILPRTSVAIATKYETAYACEGKTLTIECEPGDLINLIRANYGRFSITICNDHGNVDWSVNCMSQQSLNVLHSKCAHKQTCSVLASTNMFGDPCPGTHKYLEAHYTCISAAQTSTMTNRQTPPWQITNHPNVMWSTTPSTLLKSQIQTTVSTVSPKTILRTSTTLSSSFSSSSGPAVAVTSISSSPASTLSAAVMKSTTARIGVIHEMLIPPLIGDKQKPSATNTDNPVTTSTIVGSISHKNDENLLVNSNSNDNNPHGNQQLSTTQSTVLVNNNFDGSDNNNYYCEPKQARNLFWNITRVGEVNVQPCPGGATGIAKWRCVFIQRQNSDSSNTISSTSGSTDGGADSIRSNNRDCDQINNNNINNNKCDKNKKLNNNNNLYPTWHPVTPDLTQCRSLWLNNLEIRVNQRDSSLISIANDLSQVTSSKTLYGGDMLVTTKIIQTMSEKMSYDIETFPDQRQREAIIYELLHGVVKTGSNLLDISQQLSWLDLSFEDQMRVATSLLTGLEDNAFLLADTIIRERNVIQKVKNILLSVRVLETRNIVSNEVFPDAKLEQWQVSDDKIELPRGALIENSEGGLVRIVFVAFDRLEAILKPSYDNLDVKFSTNYLQNSIYNQTNAAQHRLRVLNSKVISASLGKGRHIQLSQPIRLVLRHLKTENVTNPTCVFWNYIDHAWSEDGCYLESTNKTHTVCMCNHLTNFAILMDIIDEHNSSLLSMFDSNMRILIYISIAICLLFILIAILTLKLFNGIFVKSTRTSIYKNIYVCLFIIEVLFLLGIEQSEVSLLCGFTTAFLHCFVLSAIAWLFFEGFQLYATLTTDDMLLEVENSSKIIWYYLLSYGLSFTIVAISLAVNPSTYTQSDFCVLMEANGLFYTTFLVPIALFVVGTIGYPLLACHIMCKKSKTTLKNKEHTRLTSVKFDLRCSFLFLIILSIDWIFAYLYLRKVKIEDENANTFGYLFITFNSLLGIYIFVFHCIQNEKIRREYRKYIRQNSWLPKCLRCSKTSSISSSTVAGTHHHHHHGQAPSQNYGTSASKKSPVIAATGGAADVYGDADVIGAGMGGGGSNLTANAVIDPSSDNIIVRAGKSSILPYQQQQTSNSSMSSISRIAGLTGTIQRHNLVLERSTGGTLRSANASGVGVIGGHVSPTSSAGSTHLIFNSMKNDSSQDWSFQQPSQMPGQFMQPGQASAIQQLTANEKNLNTSFDDSKFLYYDCKSKRLKQHPSNSRASSSSSSSIQQQQQMTPQQQHEYFYWTEKNNKKKINGDVKTHKSDTVHTFYPSYKKTMMKHFTSSSQADDEKLSDCDFTDIDSEQQQRRYYRYPSSSSSATFKHHLQQQQLSSDDDHAAESHLIHHGQHPNDCFGSMDVTSTAYHHPHPGYHRGYQQTPHQQYHHGRHKQHSNSCDLSSMTMPPPPPSQSPGGGVPIGAYYNQNNCIGPEEPVYEEILNSRMSSEMCDDDDDDDNAAVDNDDEDDVNMIMKEERYNRLRRMIANKEDVIRQPFSRQLVNKKSPILSDDDFQHHRLQQKQLSHPHQQQNQQQQVVSRNLSAMLDENNMVVCYLEPLPK